MCDKNEISKTNNRLKVNGVLKLVILKSREYDQKLIESINRTEYPPLSPNDFNCYAYPELRYQVNQVVDAEIESYEKEQANGHVNEFAKAQEVLDNVNSETDNSTSPFIDAGINNATYIENLHKEIDKKAKEEFERFNKSSSNELLDIINELKANDDKVKESNQNISFNENINKDINNESNNNSNDIINEDKMMIVQKLDDCLDTFINDDDPKSVLDLIPKIVNDFIYESPVIHTSDMIDVKQNDQHNADDEKLVLQPKFTVTLDDSNDYFKQVLDEVNEIKPNTNSNTELYDALDEFIELPDKKMN